MAVVPRSLVHVDGMLHIPQDNSSLMKTIEGGQSLKLTPASSKITDGTSRRILIEDAMEVMQCITKTAKMT